MRKKKDIKKLGVNRETLAVLTQQETGAIAGGLRQAGTIGGGGCQASIMVCSVMDTCVSCQQQETSPFTVIAQY